MFGACVFYNLKFLSKNVTTYNIDQFYLFAHYIYCASFEGNENHIFKVYVFYKFF